MFNQREYMREYMKRRNAERKAAGFCIACGKPTQEKTRCVECLKRNAAKTARRQQKLAATGRCKSCGEPKDDDGRLYCRICLKKAGEWSRRCRAKKKAAGLCTVCGAICQTGTRCQKCRDKANVECKDRRKRWKAAGLCRDCGKPAQVRDRTGQHHVLKDRRESDYCRECFLKMTARYVLGSGKHWRTLVEILDRAEWRCAYTGEELVLGVNLSFDHMNPICRFPEQARDPANIEPVTLAVNMMKRHMTKAEFIAAVRKIAANVTVQE